MNIIATQSGAYLIARSRFCVKPQRIAGNTFSWAVHDAEWITDNERREGYIAPCVAEFYVLENAFQFVREALAGAPTKPIRKPEMAIGVLR